jgi:hypothetical protein
MITTLSLSVGANHELRNFRKWRNVKLPQLPPFKGNKLHKLQIAQLSLLSPMDWTPAFDHQLLAKDCRLLALN